MSELKPCPHGKEARIINIGGLTPFSIVCWPVSEGHRCINLELGWFASRDEAIAAWNEAVVASPPSNDGEGVIEQANQALADLWRSVELDHETAFTISQARKALAALNQGASDA